MLRLGWFTTARGPGSRGFLEAAVCAISSGDLDARIEYVFSNRERGEGEGSDSLFDRAGELGIPLVCLSSARFRREGGGGPWSGHRDAFHAEAMRLLAGFGADCGVLAGYMLRTSDEMCSRMTLVNLHPALPGGPTGTWQQVIRALIDSGASESGVMVHVATEVLDGGPVLAYSRYPIRGPGFDHLWEQLAAGRNPADAAEKLEAAIRAEGLRRERPMLVETLRALAAGEVVVRDRVVTDGSGSELSGGLCLDAEVEARLQV